MIFKRKSNVIITFFPTKIIEENKIFKNMRNLAVNTQTLVETTINNNEVNNTLDIVNHFPGVGQQIGPSIVDRYGFLHGRNFENAFNRVHQENNLFLDVRNVDLFQLNNNN